MSLKIYYSSRIENLAEDLRDRLANERKGGDPFIFSQVVVPNTNIAKWLQMRVFAKTPALCAGIRFPFMEHRLTELLSRNLPSDKPVSLLPDNAYANAIMFALLAPESAIDEFGALAPLRAYVSGGDGSLPLDITTQNSARMAWQLATTLANLMDQYEVRRPEIVDRWLAAGKTANEVEAAEAALARALWGPKGAFPDGGERLSLRQLYDCVKDGKPKGPAERIYFFGQSTLSFLHVRILVWLAQTHEIVFYHNNVCLEYWGDIETKAERIKKLGKTQAEKEDIEIENPLLRQWGVAGRETMRLLVELEEENDGRIDFEWTCLDAPVRNRAQTVLGKIQESIRYRTGEVGKMSQDASLQIVGVPGIRREVEMVYNAIIGSVWKPAGSGERPWNECEFSDIAVLVPDMATYRPVIEAVFDARDEVPYGLVDTTASEDSMFLAGFLALAALARKGLTRETLFAVLDNPCVQAALGFTPDDVADWRDVTAEIGAFDGFETREGESLFNWDWALARLRLARVKSEAVRVNDEAVPLVSGGGDSALRLSEIVELLYRRVGEVFMGPAAAADWARALKGLINDFLAVPEESALEGTIRRQIVLTLDGLSAMPGEQNHELIIAAVEHFVGGISCRKGGYLTHGVTIARLQPMRPVPFKQVYVLGLGEGGFPGRTGACSTLDVRGTGWRLGDVTMPKMNRYLFLETLMSVRDRLVITYPNRDIEKDAELFPSGIVRELEDFAGGIVDDGTFEEFKNYPLLERGEQDNLDVPSAVCDVVWSPKDPYAGILPTYSRTARRIAADRAGIGKEKASAKEFAPVSSTDNARREVSARELAEFLKSPFNAVMRYRFGITLEGYRDAELEEDSPLGIADGPVKWGLEGAWLDGNGDSDGPFRKLQLSGQAPIGFLGDFAKEQFDANIAGTKDALLAFAASFGFDGNAESTSRKNYPVTIKCGNTRPAVDVRYTSVTPNWHEEGSAVSVLVTGFLKDKKVRMPPERTLEPLVAFLMHVANPDQVQAQHTLRVGVISVENGEMACWGWCVTQEEARDYLNRLTLRYLDYLNPSIDGKSHIDFTYKMLAKAMFETKPGSDGGMDWNDVLARLTSNNYNTGGSFNKNLVVEQATEKYRRFPTAEELKEIYAAHYSLPLAGQKEREIEGGAQ